MLRELVLAIGIPLVLLLLAVLAMEQWRDQLPAWLQRLAERPSWLWNTGIGLIIGLSLLVLHQKRLNPFVMAALADAISN
jgi:hypothetical protein